MREKSLLKGPCSFCQRSRFHSCVEKGSNCECGGFDVASPEIRGHQLLKARAIAGTVSEATTRGVSGCSCCNDTIRSRKYLTHHGRFIGPVSWGVLYDAERVDPEKRQTQFPGQPYCVKEVLGQVFFVHEVGFFPFRVIMLRESALNIATPAVT